MSLVLPVILTLPSGFYLTVPEQLPMNHKLSKVALEKAKRKINAVEFLDINWKVT